MKKINILIILGLFVLLLIGLTQSAYADAWNYRNDPSRVYSFDCCASEAAHLNAAMAKFNGLLNAYSNSASAKADGSAKLDFSGLEAQLSVTASDLSSSLEKFNIALLEVYPTLTEEEQLTVREAYSSLVLYLEDLTARTNTVFGREVFRIVEEVEPKGIDTVQTLNGYGDPLNKP